jgi:serine/threonine protein kinase
MLIGGSNPPFVKITDFGLARVIDDNPMTQHGVVIGTPEYMSPEQARGEGVDHRSDLFSLGSVLYAMATGTSPFRASTAIAVLRRVNDEEPTPVRTLRPDLPAWLATLIERLMAKNPAERFATADEVANLLQGYLVHLQTAAPAPALPGSPRVCEQTAKRNKRIARAAVLLGASVILSVIAGLMIYRNSPWFQANVWNVAGIGLAGIVFMAALVGFLVMRGRRSAPDELLVLLKCSSCQKEFKVKPSLNGTKVRCPSCGQLTS